MENKNKDFKKLDEEFREIFKDDIKHIPINGDYVGSYVSVILSFLHQKLLERDGEWERKIKEIEHDGLAVGLEKQCRDFIDRLINEMKK